MPPPPPLFHHGRPLTLDPAQLLQAGGEGMVFALNEQEAAKVYHQPTAAQQAKLSQWLAAQMGNGLPTAVYGPQSLLHNGQGEVVGFVMRRLPGEARPFKKLATPHAQPHLTLGQRLAALHHLHTTISALHQRGIIIGDLNDHNLFYLPHTGQVAAIDVDSYQWGGYPCPVALQSFLDPNLYPIADFSQRPVFSEGSDWYAFFVLLVKTLLYAHPYGGVHHVHKTLMARAENRITLLHGAVVYPKQARPSELLPEPLLSHFQRVFGRGERPTFPPQLLTDYAQTLTTCAQCGQEYPAQRTRCPLCHHQSRPAPIPPAHNAPLQVRLLLHTAGQILHVWPKPETNYGSHHRFHALVYHNKVYSLVYAGMNGVIDEMPLFTGEPGYRFGLFEQYLVVNPPQRPHLLVLDVSGQEPEKVTMLESVLFDGTAVFATTPRALYRIASGYLLRGQMIDGRMAEEMVGTAHRQQTQLWGSAYNDMIAGLHRIWGTYRFFVRQPKGHTAEFALPLAPHASVQEMGVSFNGDGQTAALCVQTRQQGQLHYWQFTADQPPLSLPAFATTPATQHTATLIATDQGVLKHKGHIQTLLAETADFASANDLLLPHARGLLIQQTQRLYLVEGG